MKTLVFLFALLASIASAQGSCIDCHEPQKAPLEKSAHPSLSCTDCHNGNDKAPELEAAHSAEKQFIGKPDAPQLAVMCGACHKEAADGWKKSPHFSAMVKGDPGAATCASCHTRAAAPSSHSLLDCGDEDAPTQRLLVAVACARCHSDPAAMARSGLRTDAMALYEKSDHGKLVLEQKDADGATCTDCHLPHEAPRAKDPSSSTNRRNQSKTCGGCHGDEDFMNKHNRDFRVVAKFDNSPHARNLDDGAPSCAGCHGPHAARVPAADEMRAFCGKCHQGPARELSTGAHANSTWTDPASGVSSLVHCGQCHDSHGAPRPMPPFADTSCSTCHDAASPEMAAGRALSDISANVRDNLFELHALLSKAQARGHEPGECGEVLGTLDASYHEMASMAHGVRPEKCRRASEGFAAEAKALKARLVELTPESQPLGWLPFMWGFLFVGIGLMWAKGRRAS